MPLIVTLISDPGAPALPPELASQCAVALNGSVDWLGPGIACDIDLQAGASRPFISAALVPMLDGKPVDLVIHENANRRKRILIADMDSTMIQQECIDELADEVGLKDKVAAITARSMNGEIAFEPALRERVALLRGLGVDVIDRIIDSRLTLTPGGKALVATMRANGAWTALVSGGFESFTSRIASIIGFDEQQANRLLEADGKLLGEVAEPILGREAKATALRTIAAQHGLTPADAIAVGDGANDLDMIRLAGTGVAMHAKPAVAAQADIRINHGDLTALLYIQGYRQSEFVG
jgi:phosphoserine phosphatase